MSADLHRPPRQRRVALAFPHSLGRQQPLQDVPTVYWRERDRSISLWGEGGIGENYLRCPHHNGVRWLLMRQTLCWIDSRDHCEQQEANGPLHGRTSSTLWDVGTRPSAKDSTACIREEPLADGYTYRLMKVFF